MLPDERGYFGDNGGRFVPETLVPALDELTAAWGTEFAQISYPVAERDQIHTLRAQSVRRPDQILTALRNLVAAVGPQLNFEELPPESADQPVTYFQLSFLLKFCVLFFL